MKAPLKAFSLAHAPHIIVTTSVSPCGVTWEGTQPDTINYTIPNIINYTIPRIQTANTKWAALQATFKDSVAFLVLPLAGQTG